MPIARTTEILDPLEALMAQAVAGFNAPTVAATRERTATPRPVGVWKNCIEWLAAGALAINQANKVLPFASLAWTFCQFHHVVTPGRKTPDQTIESHVRVAARDGQLPTGFAIVSAKERNARGELNRTGFTVSSDLDAGDSLYDMNPGSVERKAFALGVLMGSCDLRAEGKAKAAEYESAIVALATQWHADRA